MMDYYVYELNTCNKYPIRCFDNPSAAAKFAESKKAAWIANGFKPIDYKVCYNGFKSSLVFDTVNGFADGYNPTAP